MESKNIIINNSYSLPKKRSKILSDIKKIPAFYWLLGYIWVYETLIRYIRVVLSKIPLFGSVLSEFIPVFVLIVLVLFSATKILKAINGPNLLIAFIGLLYFLLVLLRNSPYTKTFSEEYLGLFVLYAFPLFFIGIACYKKFSRSLINFLYCLSVLSIYSSVLVLLRGGLSLVASWSANMYLAYSMLPHALMAMYVLFQRPSVIRICNIVFSVGYMIMMGNRGSLVCFIAFFLICFFRLLMNKKHGKGIVVLFSIVILTAVIYFSGALAFLYRFMFDFASKNGLSTRIFLSLDPTSGISLDSGRLDIYRKIFNQISITAFGYGPSSDWYFLGEYAHNIFLEFLIEYGYIGTTLIVLAGIILFCLSYKKSDHDRRSIILLLFCASILKLFISGTYLTDPYFYFLLGFCLSGCQNNYQKHRGLVKND